MPRRVVTSPSSSPPWVWRWRSWGPRSTAISVFFISSKYLPDSPEPNYTFFEFSTPVLEFSEIFIFRVCDLVIFFKKKHKTFRYYLLKKKLRISDFQISAKSPSSDLWQRPNFSQVAQEPGPRPQSRWRHPWMFYKHFINVLKTFSFFDFAQFPP